MVPHSGSRSSSILTMVRVWTVRKARSIACLALVISLFILWRYNNSTRPVIFDTIFHAITCDEKCLARAKLWVAPKLITSSPEKVVYIHQTWKTHVLPSRFKQWSTTWKKCFPKAKYILWTDEDNLMFVAKLYPWLLNRYLSMPDDIFRVDFVRYLYLHRYGGIYADLDTECLRPFNHLLTSGIVLGAMDSKIRNLKEGYVQNSFMYSERSHYLWLMMVHQVLDSWNSRIPEELTGPNALARAVESYRMQFQKKNDIKVYPPGYFNPFSWKTNRVKACKVFNRMSRNELAECRKAYENSSFVLQYHTHTWSVAIL